MPGRSSDFFAWKGPTRTLTLPGVPDFVVPALYYPHRFAAAMFTASLAAVNSRLPSEDLHPLRWRSGRTLVNVTGADYLLMDDARHIRPFRYGEAAVFALVTRGDKPAPPYLPLAPAIPLPPALRIGLVTLHMPITSRFYRDGGRVLYGLPKFTADIRYDQRTGHDRVVVTDGDASVFTLTVATGGRPTATQETYRLYSDLDDDLLATDMPTEGVCRTTIGPHAATLDLGDHPVADDLRELDVSPSGFLAQYFPDRRVILPPPKVVGTATRHVPTHPGDERDYGRFVVSSTDGQELEIDHDALRRHWPDHAA